MRAAIFRNGEIVVDQMPEPKPGPGQVLVRTLACGICGSDLARPQACPPHGRDWRSISPAASRWTLPATSCSATNSAARSSTTVPEPHRKLKPGTRVCSLPALVTPQGIEGIGYSNDNIGGYAEAMLLSEPLLLEVPNGLAAEHAALTEPLAVGVHAVAKANIRGGEVPPVIGCGPVGLAVIAALRIKGLHPIVAADSPARRALAARLGADIVVDPKVTQPYATWAEHAQMSEAEKAARPPLQAMLRHLGIDDDIGAQPCRERTPRRRIVGGDDRMQTLDPQRCDHREPDRAAADHERYLAAPDVGFRHGVDADGERLG